VAVSRFINEKGGTSGLDKNGGVPTSFYKARDVEFLTDVKTEKSRDKFVFVKVGDSGTLFRVYSRCCCTYLFFIPANVLLCVNTNCIYNQDGSSFEPRLTPVNVQAKYAFDPSAVPDPKHDALPLRDMVRTFPIIVGGFLPFGPKLTDQKGLFPDDEAKVDVVPITWE
jgi:hypothetical protein